MTKKQLRLEFADYPDVVSLPQFRQMLGGIGESTARKLMKQNVVQHYYIRTTYFIPKESVIAYLQSTHYAIYLQKLKAKIKTEYINNGRDRDYPIAFGRYRNVFLSKSDLYALQQEYPNDYQARIERLSEYMASTGKAYGNHLATIRSWAKKEGYSRSMYSYQSNDSL